MVILKKISGSTLMETLVSTVLIMIIFMITSMLLNNLFSNSVKYNTSDVETYLNEIEYLYINNKIPSSFQEDYKQWFVTLEQENTSTIILATNKETKKEITRTIDN